MWDKDPDDIYKDYERFKKKGNYKKAYQCLKTLHSELPKDLGLIQHIINFCYTDWRRPNLAKRWLIQLTKMQTFLYDYLFLCQIEADLGNTSQAKIRLKETKEIKKQTRLLPKDKKDIEKEIKKLEKFIKYQEWKILEESKKKPSKKPLAHPSKEVKRQHPQPKAKALEQKQTDTPPPPSGRKKEKSPSPSASQEAVVKNISTYRIPVKVSPLKESTLKSLKNNPLITLNESQLLLDFAHLLIQGEFNELLCLNTITGIEKYWYQIETVKKVLKHFHGRVLLCDEVGLGKTVETGMLIKEYLIRHMAKSVLILAPPSLVSQWKEEMQVKFGIKFKTTDDAEFTINPKKFWKTPLIIASIHTAKNKKNLSLVTDRIYDIVVVDEAHHLRNRTTQTWKAVNLIQKKFIFLLTATPVQNNLIELFNLITLLKPGQFKTEKIFKKEFLTKGNMRKPANPDKFRELLNDVMIRNTRSAIDIKLPNRFATTLRLQPTQTEKQTYDRLNNYIRNHVIKKSSANLLLREAGSSPFALEKSLSSMKLKNQKEIKEILDLINDTDDISKGQALTDLLNKNKQEKKIIFTQYLKSMDYIMMLMEKHNIPFVTFNGNMSTTAKDASIQQFKEDVPVLISTESGGEGRNIQFCNTIINFDLPWNPMRIEQRIGRLHRIGQTRDVFIFNLSVRGTIEDYIIEILDSKINMFEMVIGEIEPIIGQINNDQDFEEIITEIWMNNKDEQILEKKFEQFGDDLLTAKKEYIQAKLLDEEIFGEDYEI